MKDLYQSVLTQNFCGSRLGGVNFFFTFFVSPSCFYAVVVCCVLVLKICLTWIIRFIHTCQRRGVLILNLMYTNRICFIFTGTLILKIWCIIKMTKVYTVLHINFTSWWDVIYHSYEVVYVHSHSLIILSDQVRASSIRRLIIILT